MFRSGLQKAYICLGGPPTALEIEPEHLPCPDCRARTSAPPVTSGGEVVRCRSCFKALRSRPALTTEQRAQAEILRWAAAQIDKERTTRHRRKGRGDWREVFDDGLMKAVELLQQWSRTIHKRVLSSQWARRLAGWGRTPGGRPSGAWVRSRKLTARFAPWFGSRPGRETWSRPQYMPAPTRPKMWWPQRRPAISSPSR